MIQYTLASCSPLRDEEAQRLPGGQMNKICRKCLAKQDHLGLPVFVHSVRQTSKLLEREVSKRFPLPDSS